MSLGAFVALALYDLFFVTVGNWLHLAFPCDTDNNLCGMTSAMGVVSTPPRAGYGGKMRAPPRPSARQGVVDAGLWAVSVALLLATFVLSLGPAPPGLNAFFASDKLIHAAGYAALTASWLLAAVWRPGRGDGPFPQAVWVVVVSAIVLGAGIEVGQHFVDRSADPFDAMADAGGALVALWIWASLKRRPGVGSLR